MGSFEMTCGGGRRSSVVTDDDEESTCSSEAKEGSCYSEFYSTADSSIHAYNFDSEIDQVLDSRRVSSVVGLDCSVDIDNGVPEHKIFLGTVERDCRICHMSLQVDGDDMESGIAIELGCSCKNELAAAHQHCAETWFKFKGNNICEICNSFAQNVVIPNDIESRQRTGVHTFTTNAVSVPESTTSGTNDIESGQHISAVNTFTTNAVLVRVSSTSKTREIIENFLLIIFVALGLWLLHHFHLLSTNAT